MDKLQVPAEVYAELVDTLADSGVKTYILPEGGHAALEVYLTCRHGKGWKCGAFVCYKHNPELRPVDGERTSLIPAPGNKWSNPIPGRVIQQFTDKLELTP